MIDPVRLRNAIISGCVYGGLSGVVALIVQTVRIVFANSSSVDPKIPQKVLEGVCVVVIGGILGGVISYLVN